METTTLTINVPKNIGAMLEEQARNNGKNISDYIKELVEEAGNKQKTLDEILAPVRKNFADSGMSEEDLDDLIESERQAMWEEKLGRAKS